MFVNSLNLIFIQFIFILIWVSFISADAQMAFLRFCVAFLPVLFVLFANFEFNFAHPPEEGGGPPHPPLGAPPPGSTTPSPSLSSPLPPSPPQMSMTCPKPPSTTMLIYDQQETNIKTLDQPVAKCQCTPKLEIAYFASEKSDIPTTGGNAGQSTLNMQCKKPEDFCICDEKDQCWRLENAIAQVVLNSYCDGEDCHLFARLNNIAPFTQALVNAQTGQKLTVQDQLTNREDGKGRAYKTMKGCPDYYVKAKSITCAGAGKCAPVKCEMPFSSTPPTPTTPPTSPSSPTSPTTSPATPPNFSISSVYQGKQCVCKLIAEMTAKINMLLDIQINAINQKSAKATLNAAVLLSEQVEIEGTTFILKDELQPDATLLDQVNADIKVKLNLTIRYILASIRSSDIKGVIELYKCGCVKSMLDLQQNLQQKAPGISALMESFFMKLQLEIEASKKLLKGGATQFVDETKSMIGDCASDVIKMAGSNLSEQPELGSHLVDTFLSVFLNFNLSLGPPPPPFAASSPPPPPPSSSPPPPPSSSSFPPLSDLMPSPPYPPPFFFSSTPFPPLEHGFFKFDAILSLSLILKKWMSKIQESKDNPSELINFSSSLKLDVSAQMKMVAQKLKEHCPITPLQLMCMIKPSDVEGLQAIFQMCISGQLEIYGGFGPSSPAAPTSPPTPPSTPSTTPSTPSTSPLTPPASSPLPPYIQLYAQLALLIKQKCPGIDAAIAAFLAVTDKYMKKFGNDATGQLGKQIFSLNMELHAKIEVLLQGNESSMQEIKEAIKTNLPNAYPFIKSQIDIKAALTALLIGNMQMLSNEQKKQQMLDDMKVDDSSLNNLAESVNGQLSVNVKATMALVKPNDVDGMKTVLDMCASGQISSMSDLIKEMKEKCPGILQALSSIVKNIFVMCGMVYDKLSSKAKELIKKILQCLIGFFKIDIKVAAQKLEETVPGMVDTMLDDLADAVPSLKSIIIGIKFTLKINVTITVIQQLPPPMPTTPTTTPITPTTTAACPSGGKWGDWVIKGQCTKQCGKCGSKSQSRTCLSAPACPCSGPSSQDMPCPDIPCIFPEESCCSGLSAKSIGGAVKCP